MGRRKQRACVLGITLPRVACMELSLVEPLIGCNPECGDLSYPRKRRKKKRKSNQVAKKQDRLTRRGRGQTPGPSRVSHAVKTTCLERRERKVRGKRRREKQSNSRLAVVEIAIFCWFRPPPSLVLSCFLLGAMQVTQYWQSMMLPARRRACFGASDLRWPQPAVRQSRPSGDELGW